MASQAAHEAKADLCWQLANEYVREKREPFLCMNLIMYSVGHLIETLLAAQLKHPSSPPRGVPHGDREAQMRKHLVGKNVLPGTAADTYAELVAIRDTFVDGGIQTRAFIDHYMRLAQPLVEELKAACKSVAPTLGK